jgi:hypothetical protein
MNVGKQWKTVLVLSRQVHRSGIVGSVFINETPPDEIFNRPLVLAYCVLENVFGALIDEGKFACKRNELYYRMQAAKTALPWKNFALVDEGRKKRNELAHEAKLLAKNDCLKYVKAIGDELSGWSVI